MAIVNGVCKLVAVSCYCRGVPVFKTKLIALNLAALISVATAGSALAKGIGDLEIKTGGGEELTIKNGWFGKKTTSAKDRLGNKVEYSKGWFGSKGASVSVLGNTFERKKGLFGSGDIQAHTILGDTVKSKKGWFGRRKTTVDLSGVGSVVNNYFGKKKAVDPAKTATNNMNNSVTDFNAGGNGSAGFNSGDQGLAAGAAGSLNADTSGFSNNPSLGSTSPSSSF